MNFFESFNAFVNYGFWTLAVFVCAYVVVRLLATDVLDLPGWVVPVALIAILALWLLIPHGWNLLSYAFSGNWDYGDDLRAPSVRPDDAWFILKVKFWAAISGTVVGYFGLGKLRHEW
ncbi:MULTISPECIES: hypothetical protein [Burkholderia]|uniref:hypothetical protein n=1 Tax=Burkholderia TaxID=32008 RepID=UPI00055730E8|nr:MULTISPECIES: hypothetical protein [Burkholderia]TCT31944.1 hypothetical protein EC918_102172 [Burkholderia vietnamiensis]SCZ28186.1 hypothetical protein SAMN02787148_106264 [Burkholderia vietnamiensis]SFX63327.1 hypothetical protein SAMN02787160_106265 [Burkholderia vietnamiensis]HDR9256403.1 hypothetical protein [Burkholderia vietnamiensis]